jgi:tellurite resistance protein
MSVPDKAFIDHVKRSIARPGPNAPKGVQVSIFAQAARLSFTQAINDAVTAPTGFDPAAAALFEGAVESAYLVATCDGALDPTEDAVLRAVISAGGPVSDKQVDGLLLGLARAVALDGASERLSRLSYMVSKPAHQHEILRVAALVAHASGGVRPAERAIFDKIAQGFSLPASAVDAAVAEAESALASR